MTTQTHDAATVDCLARPPQQVPVGAVCAVRFECPWTSGTAAAREWWGAVERVLERDYCGDSFAAVLDTDASICLDLDAGEGRWEALYPAARRDQIVGSLAEKAAEITAAAGVDPLRVCLAAVSEGAWGDDVSQVELV